MHSNYSLFYTFDADQPARFREARVFGATVWTASGAAMTWGEATRKDYASEAEVQAEPDDTARPLMPMMSDSPST